MTEGQENEGKDQDYDRGRCKPVAAEKMMGRREVTPTHHYGEEKA